MKKGAARGFPRAAPQQPNAQHVLGRLKADNGGVLGRHCHVLGRSREPNDMRAVVNASAGCTRCAAPAPAR